MGGGGRRAGHLIAGECDRFVQASFWALSSGFRALTHAFFRLIGGWTWTEGARDNAGSENIFAFAGVFHHDSANEKNKKTSMGTIKQS